MNLHSSLNLWPDLLADLSHPDLLSQLMAIAICMLAGWGLSHLLMRMFHARGGAWGSGHSRVGSFLNVLSPLLSVLLIALAIPILSHWLHVALLRVALPLLSSFLLIRVVFFLLRRVFARSGNVGRVLLAFEKIFALLVWIGVALYLTGLLPELMLYLDHTTVPIGRHQESLLVILQAAMSVCVTLILALWAGAALEQRLMKLDSVHSSLRVVLARVGRAVLILLAVLVSLSLVGLDLTVLSVFGGALGVGIGLGLQKLVSSYVSGFVVLLERSLSIGDLITVDKFSGRVEEIRTRYTVLRSQDGTESVIPNEMLVSSPVVNFSMCNPDLRVNLTAIMAPDVDIDTLFPQLEQAVGAVAGVLANPAPEALLIQLGTESLSLEMVFWVAATDKIKLPSISSAANRVMYKLLPPTLLKAVSGA